jgi:hypothetical protein
VSDTRGTWLINKTGYFIRGYYVSSNRMGNR